MKPFIRLAVAAAGLLTVGLSLYGWDRWTICPMRAVFSDNSPEPRLHERPIAAEETRAIAAVLTKYNQPHRLKGQQILITPRLYFDKGLRWNYTSKM